MKNKEIHSKKITHDYVYICTGNTSELQPAQSEAKQLNTEWCSKWIKMIASTHNASRHTEYSFKKCCLLFVQTPPPPTLSSAVEAATMTTTTTAATKTMYSRVYAHLVHTNAHQLNNPNRGKYHLSHTSSICRRMRYPHHPPNCFPFRQM